MLRYGVKILIGSYPLVRRLYCACVGAALILGPARLDQSSHAAPSTDAAAPASAVPRESTIAARTIDFHDDIQPLLARKCLRCHGPDRQEGGLRLDDRDIVGALLPSGRKAIVAGRPDESELVRRLTADESETAQLVVATGSDRDERGRCGADSPCATDWAQKTTSQLLVRSAQAKGTKRGAFLSVRVARADC